MINEWKDTTTRSRSARGVSAEATSWTLELQHKVKITITSNHIYHQGHWVMHCHSMGIDTKPLDMTTEHPLSGVKRKAVKIAHQKARQLHGAFCDYLEQDDE